MIVQLYYFSIHYFPYKHCFLKDIPLMLIVVSLLWIFSDRTICIKVTSTVHVPSTTMAGSPHHHR